MVKARSPRSRGWGRPSEENSEDLGAKLLLAPSPIPSSASSPVRRVKQVPILSGMEKYIIHDLSKKSLSSRGQLKASAVTTRTFGVFPLLSDKGRRVLGGGRW